MHFRIFIGLDWWPVMMNMSGFSCIGTTRSTGVVRVAYASITAGDFVTAEHYVSDHITILSFERMYTRGAVKAENVSLCVFWRVYPLTRRSWIWIELHASIYTTAKMLVVYFRNTHLELVRTPKSRAWCPAPTWPCRQGRCGRVPSWGARCCAAGGTWPPSASGCPYPPCIWTKTCSRRYKGSISPQQHCNKNQERNLRKI